MVERGGLENRCGRKSTEGSNPSLSAIQLFSQALSWSVKMPASSQQAFARAELQAVMQGDAACLHNIT